MKANLRLVFTIPIFFLCFYGISQDSFWKVSPIKSSKVSNSLKKMSVKQANVYTLDENSFRKGLENISGNLNTSKLVYFPDESGQILPFNVVEASVFSPELAQKYPQIKSYKGVGATDPTKKIRFSVSQNGVQSMLVDKHASEATFMQKTTTGAYLLYSRKPNDIVDKDFICATNEIISKEKASAKTAKLGDDQVLRKFRLAIAATGEYTQYHGGTKADALAAINATVTRINMVFETDLAITLELVANTDAVIYTNAATDPFSGNLNQQAQNTFNNLIGASNYDIGHLLNKATNSGDAGFVGAVCSDSKKGSAYSSGTVPEGDLFDIDFVAHEMGHQLGANHTWSFEPEGTLVQAEPGSGTTIMGYAGISGVNNVAPHGDDYFHYNSIQQIAAYVETTTCATQIPLVNTPPGITVTPDYTIPKGTAFVLTGIANDADAADVLTYSWEQIDNGVVTNSTFGPDNPSGPNFRSQRPTIAPERYFPKLSRVMQGNLTQSNPTVNSAWETVSNVARELNFALTVRDNSSGGGQVTSDEVKVNVINDAGPFTIASQATNVSYEAGSIQEVSWDVANTTNASVNAQQVDIFLSIDGGLTFPFLVAENVANDGSHRILIPGEATSQARIMVKARTNIFFAVNASNFTITASEVVLNFSSLAVAICQPLDGNVPFIYETNLGFSETATFSVSGMPSGLSAAFSQPTASADNTPVTITFSNTDAIAPGTYPITVTATSTSITKAIAIDLKVSGTAFDLVNLTAPLDTQTALSLYPLFEWDEEVSSTAYVIEIATNADFSTIVETATIIANTYTSLGLLPETAYYWRVKPLNDCGEGNFGSAFSFTTIAVDCAVATASLLPITIPSSGTPTVVSTISFLEDLPITDVNVILDITHAYLGDLTITLTSPQGTRIVLVANSCGDERRMNISATFDDNGTSFSCGTNPAISGTVKPLGTLASFNGELSKGDWILEIKDNAGGDGGSLTNFSLELCVEGGFRPDDDHDGVYDDGLDLCLGTPEGQEVDTNGCPVYRFGSTNFSVALDSESCRNNDDGAIRIVATTSLSYAATITGNGINTIGNFTSFYALDNLTAGNYTVCISGTDGVITYEDYCFDVVITQPEELNVTTSLSADEKRITLFLKGAESYRVDLNGFEIISTGDEIVLNLKDGLNTLKVSTDLACQGVYEDTILVADQPYLYPNPAAAATKIYTGIANKSCSIRVYAITGKLVKTLNYTNAAILELELSDLPAGLYLVQLEGENLKQTFKLIKI